MSRPGGRRASRYNITTYQRKTTNKAGEEVLYWEGSWDAPRDLTGGKRKQITGTSRRSQVEAEMRTEEKIEEFLARASGDFTGPEKRTRKAAAPVNTLRTDHTVQEFLEEWYQAQVDSDRWAPNSAIRIQQAFRDHIFPYLGATPLTELTKKDVRLLFTKTLPGLTKKDKNGKDTGARLLGDNRINYIFTNFRAAIRAADAKAWIDGDPTFQVHMPTPSGPSGADEMIVELMNKLLVVFRDRTIDDPDTLRVALSFFQGMRRGEARGLCWKDITNLDGLGKPTIKVQRQLGYVSARQGGEGTAFTDSTKTKRDRTIPVQKRVAELLRSQRDRIAEWKQSPDWNPRPGFEDLVDIGPSGNFPKLNDDNERVYKWFERVGISVPGAKPGSLRHASATWWATVVGQDEQFLKDVLGWSQHSDLNHYYTRVNQDLLADQMSRGDDF
jgi:integrase